MSDLAIIGICQCGDRHRVSVPDEDEMRFQKPLERVVCGQCSCTVEDLKIVGDARFHDHRKHEPVAAVI